jgi:CBS domain-containing protein
MKCQDLMTKHIKMCTPECSIKDAVQLMQDLNCGAIPIINDDHEPVGMVTDRDIALYTILNNKDPQKNKVSEFMSKPVITCFENEDIDTAIQKMKEYKIRRIPVIDEKNKISGIISLGDIAVISNEEEETFEALHDISTPVSSSK